MTETIIEYYTAAHSMPLVFVANMGLIYIKGGSKGFQVDPHFFGLIVFLLDLMIKKGGDFEVVNSSLNDIQICLSANGVSFVGITPRDVFWTKWWTSFIKIQKRLNDALWKRHRPNLKLITAFKETDRARMIPSEIMSDIIHAYFEPSSRSRYTPKEDSCRVLTRIVQTNSFKMQKLNLLV
jgi:hypothetical protein